MQDTESDNEEIVLNRVNHPDQDPTTSGKYIKCIDQYRKIYEFCLAPPDMFQAGYRTSQLYQTRSRIIENESNNCDDDHMLMIVIMFI